MKFVIKIWQETIKHESRMRRIYSSGLNKSIYSGLVEETDEWYLKDKLTRKN